MKPIGQWFKRVAETDRRKSPRRTIPGLHAHYWDGGASAAHVVVEISGTGLFLATEERWYLGTLVTMSLQISSAAEGDPERSITVRGKVVRANTDGVALAFNLPEGKEWKVGSRNEGNPEVEEAPGERLRKFLEHADHESKNTDGHGPVQSEAP